jgi:hypothetical protein
MTYSYLQDVDNTITATALFHYCNVVVLCRVVCVNAKMKMTFTFVKVLMKGSLPEVY